MAKVKKKKWIQAMNMKKGALTRQAVAAGMTPMEFAEIKQNAPGKTGKRARLALTLSKLSKKKKS